MSHSVGAAPAKPDRAAVRASDAALATAIEALEKEVLAHASDLKSPLRAKCDYFAQNPPRNPILPDALVAALDETYSVDAPSDSYVKWQLLSAAPVKFEGDLARAAAIAYLDAARPIPRPGLGAADKKELDGYAKDVKTPADAAFLTQKLADLVKAWEERNAPVLAFRDELYARLPRGGEALVARLEDDAQRVEAGYESAKEMQATLEAIDQWIDTKPPASHLQVLADRTGAWMVRRGGKPASAAPDAKWPNAAGTFVKYGKHGAVEPPPFPPAYYDNIQFIPDGLDVINQPRARNAPVAGQWKWSSASAPQVDLEAIGDVNVNLDHYAKVARAAEAAKKR